MKSTTSKTLKIFWQHAWKYKYKVLLLSMGIILVELLQIYTPLLYRDLFNLLGGNTGAQTFGAVKNLIYLILILNLLRIALWRVHNFLNNYFQPAVMADLTNSCYQYLQKHSMDFFSGSFVGSLVTKVKRYEKSFEVIADQIYYDLGRSILDTGIILSVLFWQYQKFAVVIFIWCIFYFLFAYKFSVYKLPWDIKRAAADSLTTAQLADSITNNSNIKLFSSYSFENSRFYQVTKNQYDLRKKSWDLGTIGDIVQSTAMILLEFGIIFWAVIDWTNGKLLVGDIVLLQAFIYRISDKLWNTGKNIRSIYEALADANEMTEILTTPHEVADHSEKMLSVHSGEIEFKKVNFQYKNGNKVLTNFNLKINSKEKIAIIGPSGGGKTTFVKLLVRFVDINKGKILIDGQDISQVSQDSLRNAISFVPQEPVLFHRSLMENIKYAKPEATEKEVISAAKLAHAHEFISGLNGGYAALVGERGIKLCYRSVFSSF
jgi:ATP-binding cassette subfamily B protein